MIKKIYTDKAPEAVGPYSQAIIYNNILYTSGQIAINPASGDVEETSIEGQAIQVIRNLQVILEEVGSNFNNVIKTTCFLKDMKDFQKFNNIYEKYFVSKPARSCLAVKELPKDVLVEIELIAAIK